MSNDTSENVPNDFGNPSETIINSSESFGTISETLPNHFGNDAPPESILPKAQRAPDHTLTVRDVSRILEAEHASVTERTVVNWCKPNAKGECRLDCFFDDSDNRWFVTPMSVEKIISDVRKNFGKVSEPNWSPSESFGNVSENLPNDFGNKSAVSESFPKRIEVISEAPSDVSHDVTQDEKIAQTRQEEGDNERDKMFQLEAELLQLKIENGAKEFFIKQLKEDRESFRKNVEAERQQYIRLISEQATSIGQYKQKLLQIEAPSDRNVREASVSEELPNLSEEPGNAPEPVQTDNFHL